MADGHLTPLASLEGRDPFGAYEHYRADGPVIWDDSMQAWLVASYDLCRFVMEREDLFPPKNPNNPIFVKVRGGPRNVVIRQGDEHRATHILLIRLLSPKVAAQYREKYIRPVVASVISRFAGKGRAELGWDFAHALVIRSFLAVCGLAWEDDALAQKVYDLHMPIVHWIEGGAKGDGEEALAAAEQIREFVMPIIEARRDGEGDDLISRMWREGPQVVDGFTADDVYANVRELFLAGTDTTAIAIANAIYLLVSNENIRRSLKESGADKIAVFVEEVLRLYGAVQFRFRMAKQDYVLGDKSVRAGDTVIVINAAANRDPQRFGCPAQLDLERQRPRQHLAFNAGPRTCVGAALARVELIEAVTQILDRTENLRFDPEASPPSFGNLLLRSHEPLNVLFDEA
ncbi:cytochrome P450 [Sphingomonas sp. DBB INV C78]|uniref:cytochrome P450 n=1 Tax=Sphingomonas sp. DBB INV C78 TaxID=3349434 RepID=UPI0036D2A6DF